MLSGFGTLVFVLEQKLVSQISVAHGFLSFVICLSDHFDSANKWHRTKFQEFSFPTRSAEKPQMVIFAVTWLTDQRSAPATMVKITYHIELKDMEAEFHRFTEAQGTATRRHTRTGRDSNRRAQTFHIIQGPKNDHARRQIKSSHRCGRA